MLPRWAPSLGTILDSPTLVDAASEPILPEMALQFRFIRRHLIRKRLQQRCRMEEVRFAASFVRDKARLWRDTDAIASTGLLPQTIWRQQLQRVTVCVSVTAWS